VSGRKTIRVGTILCASHVDARHRMHGHTYEVWATFRAGACAMARQSHLQAVVAAHDHTILPVAIQRAEDLVEAIALGIDDGSCLSVEVNRPAERIYARWEQ